MLPADFSIELTDNENGAHILDELSAKAALVDKVFVYFSADHLHVKGAAHFSCKIAGDASLAVFFFEDELWLLDESSLGDPDDGDAYEQAAHKACSAGNVIDISHYAGNMPLWEVKPRFGYEPFHVLRSGEIYCLGAIFDLERIKNDRNDG